MLDKLLYIALCIAFAAVLGVTWGLIVGLADLQTGVYVGNILFFVALMIFIRRMNEHDREFNAKEAEGGVAPPMEGKIQ